MENPQLNHNRQEIEKWHSYEGPYEDKSNKWNQARHDRLESRYNDPLCWKQQRIETFDQRV